MMKNAYFKKLKNVGPGGMRCPCCGPAPKHRKAFLRAVKRFQRAETRKEIQTAEF